MTNTSSAEEATPLALIWARAPSKAEAQASIASEAIAGVPMRLVQRLEVRHDATSPSQDAAARIAAAGPCTSSSRKMKISAPAIEVLVFGMRTGKRPTSAATAAPISTCSHRRRLHAQTRR